MAEKRLYVEGRCPECGARIAAAVHWGDDKSFKQDTIDFTKEGLRVRQFETEFPVSIESHDPDCSMRKDEKQVEDPNQKSLFT